MKVLRTFQLLGPNSSLSSLSDQLMLISSVPRVRNVGGSSRQANSPGADAHIKRRATDTSIIWAGPVEKYASIVMYKSLKLASNFTMVALGIQSEPAVKIKFSRRRFHLIALVVL